jgi:hypothetical protein
MEEYKSLPIPALSGPIQGPKDLGHLIHLNELGIRHFCMKTKKMSWIPGCQENVLALTNDTLPQYWLRQRKLLSVYRLDQMGLDMACIPGNVQ